MSSFPEIFDSTAAFLKKKGISVEVNGGAKASMREVEKFHRQTGIVLPESFASFYTGFANGYEFIWQKDDETWGRFSIPNLDEIAVSTQDWLSNIKDFLDNPHSLDQCVKPPFRAEAFDIWKRMRGWAPMRRDTDGDHFCVETSSGRILYDQHDWFDGFGSLAKTNGIVAGESLGASQFLAGLKEV